MHLRRSTAGNLAEPPRVLVDSRRTTATAVATFAAPLVLVILPVVSGPGWFPMAAIPIIPLWVWLIVRAARSRVEVTPEAVTVHRVFSTRTVPASDYDGVTWTIALFPTSGVSLQIRRKSGRPITAACVPSFTRGAFTVPVEDEVASLGQEIEATLVVPHNP